MAFIDGTYVLAALVLVALLAYGLWLRWDDRRREERQLHLRVQRNLARMNGERS